MKFLLIGQTTYAWAELVKELPSEHVSALQSQRINIQSANGFIRLLSKFDHNGLDLNCMDAVQPYILDLWTWTFWFELPFELIEEVLSKTKVRILNVPNPRNSCNRGMMQGSLSVWRDVVLMGGKPFVTTAFTNLTKLVSGAFDRENLNFLLNKVV